MKKAIVVYSSKRGSTKQYAEWIAEELKLSCECELVPFKDSKSCNLYEYDLIVYGGWIRGSGIVDFDLFSKNLDSELLARMVVFGCGVADETPDNYMQVWSLNIGKIDPHNDCRSVLYILGGRYNPAAITGLDKMLMAVAKKVMLAGATPDAEGAAAMMKDRLENGCDLVKRENINSLVKDCLKKLG